MGIRAALRTLVGIVVLFGSLVAATACVSAGGRMYVRVGPPAPIVEARMVSRARDTSGCRAAMSGTASSTCGGRACGYGRRVDEPPGYRATG